jgi:endonuclease/exonuclease/phosphatase family metal-dependent hydrolase
MWSVENYAVIDEHCCKATLNTRINSQVRVHLKKEFLVVAGDLNDTPDSKPLKPLLSKQGLFNVNLKLPPADRFTFRSTKEQLDYLLVSKALKDKLTNVAIERRGIIGGKFQHFPTVTSRRTEASDHGAVLADFQL